jgi:DivIVA domain-containing protein
MMSDSEADGAERQPRLTPVDVQQQQFRRAFRGYHEQEVDDFLDRITEDLSAYLDEQQRLRHQIGATPTSDVAGTGDAAEWAREGAELKARAQEEAAVIVREAHARAEAIVRDAETRAQDTETVPAPSAPAPVSGEPSVAPFVTRERAFLQDLARLIQGHAEAVKEMVQAARAGIGDRARGADAPSLPPAPLIAPPRTPPQEPFGPAGVSAGRDIDETDDARAATAGTADASEEVGITPAGAEIPEVLGPGAVQAAEPAQQDLEVGEPEREAEQPQAGPNPQVIEVPEAEPRPTAEPSPVSAEAEAPVAFGGAAAEIEGLGDDDLEPANLAGTDEEADDSDSDGPGLPHVPSLPPQLSEPIRERPEPSPAAAGPFGRRDLFDEDSEASEDDSITPFDEEPEGATVARDRRSIREDDPRSERETSLRELFWGED